MDKFDEPVDAHFNSLMPPLQLGRRAFIATTVATGFTLASGAAIAQTAIHTSAEGLTAGPVQIPVADGHMPGYRAMPAHASHPPIVLVVNEVFGVHEYIQDLCRRLAHLGYLAVAPEVFAREGDPAKYTDTARLMAEVINKTPDGQVLTDLDSTAKWAASQGGDSKRLAITGFCWGGRIVWLYTAHNPHVRVAAAWYGPLRGKTDALKPRHPVDIAGTLHAPVLGAYGGQDQGITQDDVAAMRAALAKGSKAAKESKIIVYADAPHGFDADYRPSYRKADADLAWQRMLDWFKEHGVAPGKADAKG